MEQKELYFGHLNIDDIEMTLILKNGEKIPVPNMYVAISFIEGKYKDQVSNVESKTIYSVK